jgi:ferredoxin--NADP+ reductase
VRGLLQDLAGGPGPDDAPLPRAGLLRLPAPSEVAPGPDSPLAALLAGRGVRPVSYDEWLRIEEAEASLAKTLGRGDRVKLPGSDAIWSACRP